MSAPLRKLRARAKSNSLLGTTLFWSTLGHVVAILSISFVAPEFEEDSILPTLDVVLVNSRTEEAPEDPTHIAQANQDGGGESEDAERPSTPELVSQGMQGAPDGDASQARTGEQVPNNEPTPTILASNTASVPETITPEKDEQEEAQAQLEQAGVDETERQQLTAELKEFWSTYQKRPRRKFITARTKENKFAEYMEKWRVRVEMIGNENYPAEARARKISGTLLLDVAIRKDGSLEPNGIVLKRSSNKAVLDAAVIDIVMKAAPFEPFPASFRDEIDILHITRTWEFLTEYRLTSH